MNNVLLCVDIFEFIDFLLIFVHLDPTTYSILFILFHFYYLLRYIYFQKQKPDILDNVHNCDHQIGYIDLNNYQLWNKLLRDLGVLRIVLFLKKLYDYYNGIVVGNSNDKMLKVFYLIQKKEDFLTVVYLSLPYTSNTKYPYKIFDS